MPFLSVSTYYLKHTVFSNGLFLFFSKKKKVYQWKRLYALDYQAFQGIRFLDWWTVIVRWYSTAHDCGKVFFRLFQYSSGLEKKCETHKNIFVFCLYIRPSLYFIWFSFPTGTRLSMEIKQSRIVHHQIGSTNWQLTPIHH